MKLKERSPPANNSPKHGTQIVHMCQNISLVKQLPNLPFINSFKLTTKHLRFKQAQSGIFAPLGSRNKSCITAKL
jgi:hypothetical protein